MTEALEPTRVPDRPPAGLPERGLTPRWWWCIPLAFVLLMFITLGVMSVAADGHKVTPATVVLNDGAQVKCSDTFFWGWGQNLKCLVDGTQRTIQLSDIKEVIPG
jgi:hypothetical protein